MKIGIVAEGTGDQAILILILKAVCGFDSSEVFKVRPDLDMDETEIAEIGLNPTLGGWTRVRHECIEARLLQKFWAEYGYQPVVIQIDTAEAEHPNFDVVKPKRGDDSKEYCQTLRNAVVEKIESWLGENLNLTSFYYAVCIEEMEAWALTLYEEKDSAVLNNPKDRFTKTVNKKLSDKERKIFSQDEFKAMHNLCKDFKKIKTLQQSCNRNASLRLFCESLAPIQSMEVEI